MRHTGDPVRDMRVLAWASGFSEGQRCATLWLRLRWLLGGAVLGAALMLWSATAWAQVPLQAEQYRRDLTRIAISVWGLDAPVSLLAGQIEAESAWRPRAVSSAGARGLTQFIDTTARDIAARYIAGPPNPFDPRWAMQAQSYYMRELLGQVGPARNDTERMAFALSAYNGGLRRVRQRQALSPDPARCLGLTCDLNPGISVANQRENRTYPRRILLVLAPRYHAAGWGGADIYSRLGA